MAQPEPDNSAAIAYMSERMHKLRNSPKATASPQDFDAEFAQHLDETI